jgi:aryl-alcohol dehydrogenase-like predicted oxidoreductase
MGIDRVELQNGYSISRIIKGGWHLAGGHGSVDEQNAIYDMRKFVEAGITTFDCADIYTGVEELIGKFLKKHREAFNANDLPPVQIHTKYVPDYDALASLKKEGTERIIDRSLQRLGVEQLDLVQFAWWDYSVSGYVEAGQHLKDLQQKGKIRHIGITNFDAKHIKELLEAGIPIIANQLQYSVLDHRPQFDSQEMAEEYDVPFLCYGSIAGGFISDRYLNVPDPKAPLENRSLVKYRLIIDEFGGYQLFQSLLQTLRTIADKHQVDIAETAMAYVLQKSKVASVIVGARNQNHIDKLTKVAGIQLDKEDLALIQSITIQSKGPNGPVNDLERDKTGKHGSIMRYNLNN